MVLAKQADAWISSSLNEEKEALYPKWHHNQITNNALYLKNAVKQ